MLREELEKFEMEQLSPLAQKASNSQGRRLEEEECPIRTVYQRDRDRILHSKAFRRLKHKTQVFLSPEGDHYRTRLTHTLEVSQIARTISRGLMLNQDLTEAIALGHDLGHTPFGHCGEARLNKIHPSGFLHNEQSLRVVDYLERRNGSIYGLNLTAEVRDGILNHSGKGKPSTLEGEVVGICDRIAYLNHDIDDAIRAGVLREDDIPKEIAKVLGATHGIRINTLIYDVLQNSEGKEHIAMSEPIHKAFLDLRQFMFQKVYLNPEAKSEEKRAEDIVESLYLYFIEHPDEMPKERLEDYKNGAHNEAIKDFVSGMSDRYAVNLYKELFIPQFWLY